VLLFLDNDIILKLASISILSAIEEIFDVTADSVYILPSAKAYIAKSKNVKKLYSQDVIETALKIISNYQSIEDNQVNDAHFRNLANNDNIDSGEQILFSIDIAEDYLILTGDKSAICALHANPNYGMINKKLKNKIVCLEKILLLYLGKYDFNELHKKIVASNYCSQESVVEVVFGQQNITKDKAQEGLASYYTDLKNNTGSLLYLFIFCFFNELLFL
jgi:hypothetical protein